MELIPQILISLNLNITTSSIGSSESIWSIMSSSLNSVHGSWALSPLHWLITNGGISWCPSCLHFASLLMCWFSMLNLLAYLEPLVPLFFHLHRLSLWWQIRPSLWKWFGWKENVSKKILSKSSINQLSILILAGKIFQVLKNSWTKHLSITFNEKYNFGRFFYKVFGLFNFIILSIANIMDWLELIWNYSFGDLFDQGLVQSTIFFPHFY